MNTLFNESQVAELLKANDAQFVSFEHSAIYDCDLSRIYFDDFKSEVENHSLWFGDRQTDYLVIFESEALKNAPYYKVSHLNKMSKQALYDLCEQYEILDYYYSNSDFNTNKKQDLIDEIMRHVDNEKHYTMRFHQSRWYDLECDFVVRGYSQGDAIKVLLVGKVESYINCDFLTNVFYDTPLCVKISIDVNYNFYDEVDLYCGEYVFYDKAECLNILKRDYSKHEYFNQLLEYAEKHLPSEAKYNY